MNKKLNIAFVWHFHQPSYQEDFNKDFLMPWVRLHATKDYLDMLYHVEDFKGLKLNFNFSPVLISSLIKYTNGAHDLHSRLLISEINDLNPDEKAFILDNFFDANYSNMILTRKYYTELYNKRYSKDAAVIEDFSNQEYADIMANYTLCWIDKKFIEHYDDLKSLFDKEHCYTLEDRRRIFDISIDIIKKIIPTYKYYQDEGKIEISTNPYYHPILPLLLNTSEQHCAYSQNLPLNPKIMQQDAVEQTKRALDFFEETFGKKPNGIWLSEQCISAKTIDLLNKLDVKWTIADEGILASSVNKEFQRDFEGNLQDPFMLAVDYKLKSRNNTHIVFSDSFFSNIISFGYGNFDPKLAANDLYEKIKNNQNRLDNSPNEEHLLTIAMDGENCWESYVNDGTDFLQELYSLIEDDESLETVTMSEYLSRTKNTIKLDNIKSGSWINRNFDLWIGEPVKNLAWSYLNTTIEDFNEFKKHKKNKELIKKAQEEIYLAQGSDWFWWYGEPNDSGRDYIFDHIFRERLKNVYKILDKEYPNYLNIPLASIIGKPIRQPRKNITPIIDGIKCEEEDRWENAGCILLPDSPTFSSKKVLKVICYGSDEDSIYLKFEINKANTREPKKFYPHQVFVYFRIEGAEFFSPIRQANTTSNAYPIVKNKFSHEIKFAFSKDEIIPPQLNVAIADGLWAVKGVEAQYAYKDLIEIAIPFKNLDAAKDAKIEFCVTEARDGILDAIYPQDVMLYLVR